jgi:hypothetical protein
VDPRHELKLPSLGLTESASRPWHDDKLLGLYVSVPPFPCLVCCSLFRVILKRGSPLFHCEASLADDREEESVLASLANDYEDEEEPVL